MGSLSYLPVATTAPPTKQPSIGSVPSVRSEQTQQISNTSDRSSQRNSKARYQAVDLSLRDSRAAHTNSSGVTPKSQSSSTKRKGALEDEESVSTFYHDTYDNQATIDKKMQSAAETILEGHADVEESGTMPLHEHNFSRNSNSGKTSEHDDNKRSETRRPRTNSGNGEEDNHSESSKSSSKHRRHRSRSSGKGDDNNSESSKSSKHKRRSRSSSQPGNPHHQKSSSTDGTSNGEKSKRRSKSSSGHHRHHRSRSRDPTRMISNASSGRRGDDASSASPKTKHRSRRAHHASRQDPKKSKSLERETREERDKRKDKKTKNASHQQKDTIAVILGNGTLKDEPKQPLHKKVHGPDSSRTATTSATTSTSNANAIEIPIALPDPPPPPPSPPPESQSTPENTKSKRENLTRSVSPLRMDPSLSDSMHQIQQSLSSERWNHDETLWKTNRLMRDSEMHNSFPSDLAAFFSEHEENDDEKFRLSPGQRSFGHKSFGDFEMAVRSKKKGVSLNNYFENIPRRAKKGTSRGGGAPSVLSSSRRSTGSGGSRSKKKTKESNADELSLVLDGLGDEGDFSYHYDEDETDNASTTSFDIAPGLPKRQNSSDLEDMERYNARLDLEAEQDMLEEEEISNVLSTGIATPMAIGDDDNDKDSSEINDSNSSSRFAALRSKFNKDGAQTNQRRQTTKRMSIKKKKSKSTPVTSDSTGATMSSETNIVAEETRTVGHAMPKNSSKTLDSVETSTRSLPAAKSAKSPTIGLRQRVQVPNTTGGIKKKLLTLEAIADTDDSEVPPLAPFEETSPRKSKKKKKKRKDRKKKEQMDALANHGYISPELLKRKSVLSLAKSKVGSLFSAKSSDEKTGYGAVNDESLRLREDDNFWDDSSSHSKDQSNSASMSTTPIKAEKKLAILRRKKSKSPKSAKYQRSLSLGDASKLQQQVRRAETSQHPPPPPPPLPPNMTTPELAEEETLRKKVDKKEEPDDDDVMDKKIKSKNRRHRANEEERGGDLSGDKEGSLKLKDEPTRRSRRDTGDEDEGSMKLNDDSTRHSSRRSESRNRHRSRSRNKEKSSRSKSRSKSQSKSFKSRRDGRESSRQETPEGGSIVSKRPARTSRSMSPGSLMRRQQQSTSASVVSSNTSNTNNRSRSPGAVRGDIARKRHSANEFREKRRSQREVQDVSSNSRPTWNEYASQSPTHQNSPKRRSRIKVISSETLELTRKPTSDAIDRTRMAQEFDPTTESLSDLAKRVKEKAEKLRAEQKSSNSGFREDVSDRQRSNKSEARRPALPDVYAKSLQW